MKRTKEEVGKKAKRKTEKRIANWEFKNRKGKEWGAGKTKREI